jgi:hypothetical protein
LRNRRARIRCELGEGFGIVGRWRGGKSTGLRAGDRVPLVVLLLWLWCWFLLLLSIVFVRPSSSLSRLALPPLPPLQPSFPDVPTLVDHIPSSFRLCPPLWPLLLPLSLSSSNAFTYFPPMGRYPRASVFFFTSFSLSHATFAPLRSLRFFTLLLNPRRR